MYRTAPRTSAHAPPPARRTTTARARLHTLLASFPTKPPPILKPVLALSRASPRTRTPASTTPLAADGLAIGKQGEGREVVKEVLLPTAKDFWQFLSLSQRSFLDIVSGRSISDSGASASWSTHGLSSADSRRLAHTSQNDPISLMPVAHPSSTSLSTPASLQIPQRLHEAPRRRDLRLLEIAVRACADIFDYDADLELMKRLPPPLASTSQPFRLVLVLLFRLPNQHNYTNHSWLAPRPQFLVPHPILLHLQLVQGVGDADAEDRLAALRMEGLVYTRSRPAAHPHGARAPSSPPTPVSTANDTSSNANANATRAGRGARGGRGDLNATEDKLSTFGLALRCSSAASRLTDVHASKRAPSTSRPSARVGMHTLRVKEGMFASTFSLQQAVVVPNAPALAGLRDRTLIGVPSPFRLLVNTNQPPSSSAGRSGGGLAGRMIASDDIASIDTCAAALHSASRGVSLDTAPSSSPTPQALASPLHLAAALDRTDVVDMLLAAVGAEDTLLHAQGHGVKPVARGHARRQWCTPPSQCVLQLPPALVLSRAARW
ncbi:hypothetical protein C8R46DRAFT_1208051 [Mycena filopes]|nr:hypothetical protein C8R46DRAFT_1208051 [Mycena filopes]